MNITIFDHFIKHAVSVERYTSGKQLKFQKIVNGLDAQALSIIDEVLVSYGSGHLSQEALQLAITDVITVYSEGYGTNFKETIARDLATFVESEYDFQLGSLNRLTANSLSPTATITSQQISAISVASPIQGEPIFNLIDGLSARKAEKLMAAVRVGIQSGQPISDISKNISGVLSSSKNDLKTIIRTAIQSNAATVRHTIYEENSDIIDGVRWFATLDNRTTTTICGPRDGKLYTLSGEPIDHDYVWMGGPGKAHWNCRSTEIPDIPEANFGGRPAISAGRNYQSGDNKTSGGKITKATKSRREKGIYNVQQVRGTTNYEDWLRRQPADFQNDILGIKKGKLFRSGQISLDDLSDRFGAPITLEELSAQNLIDIGDDI